jgi:hypothetical protein
VRRLRGSVGKFPDANREGFAAMQGSASGRLGMPWEMSDDIDADMLMPPSSHDRQSVPCDCGNFTDEISVRRCSHSAHCSFGAVSDVSKASVG